MHRNNPIGDRGREDCQRLSPNLTPFRSPSLYGRHTHGRTLSRLPDPQGSSIENKIVALELKERKRLRKDMPRMGIKVDEELEQTSECADTHEVV